MPSTACPSASFSAISASCGWRLPQLLGAGPHLVGEQQLAARRRPQPAHRLQRALVGHREGPDLLDLVAPELHPQRVLLGRREDVDDAAADRELAALLHQVDPGVRRGGEPAHHVVELDLVADGELDRLEVGEAAHLRLEHRADRRDDHLDRAVRGVRAGVPQPPQHREPAADGVAAGREPLVRQGLPGRVVGDLGRVHQPAQRGHQVLGLTGGRRDREHGAPGVHEPLDHERAQRTRCGQVERRDGAAAGVGHRGGEGLVLQDQVGQAADTHEVLLVSRQHDGPLSTPARGWEGCGVPVYEVAPTPRSASLRSTQNSLPSGSARVTQPVPSPRIVAVVVEPGSHRATAAARPPRRGCGRWAAGRSACGS